MSETPKVCPFLIATAERAGDALCKGEHCAFWIHEVRQLTDTKSHDYSECSIPYLAKAAERISQT